KLELRSEREPTEEREHAAALELIEQRSVVAFVHATGAEAKPLAGETTRGHIAVGERFTEPLGTSDGDITFDGRRHVGIHGELIHFLLGDRIEDRLHRAITTDRVELL